MSGCFMMKVEWLFEFLLLQIPILIPTTSCDEFLMYICNDSSVSKIYVYLRILFIYFHDPLIPFGH